MLKQVTKKVFYKAMERHDVIISLVKPWPYTTILKSRGKGVVLGKIVDSIPVDQMTLGSKYFLNR